ncbi:MAG TPA: methionyl-tRNA formyltransferase [Gemmatimonadales bacterium]|nr:methionyl-tRNA formyltransferase [Gemmatimonadales bacterium]
MKVVFFGTPEFAVPSLRALLGEGFDVVGVVTRPDRPRGRSRSRVVPPPVKTVAEAEGIPVLQPDRPVGDLFAKSLANLGADIGVVVAYGHILRPEILAVPSHGMINVHASLLPKLRGPAPIQWAILNGDETTGVSIMQMEAGLDTGPVLHQIATEVAADETAGELAVRLAELGAAALIEALTLLEAGAVRPKPQDHALATYAPKVDRGLARLVWEDDAARLARRVRAFDPAPGAWATLDGKEVKLYGARVTNGSAEPGTVIEADERLVIAGGVGAMEVLEVQPAGKCRMSATAWIRGRGVRAGQRFA